MWKHGQVLAMRNKIAMSESSKVCWSYIWLKKEVEFNCLPVVTDLFEHGIVDDFEFVAVKVDEVVVFELLEHPDKALLCHSGHVGQVLPREGDFERVLVVNFAL